MHSYGHKNQIMTIRPSGCIFSDYGLLPRHKSCLTDGVADNGNEDLRSKAEQPPVVARSGSVIVMSAIY